MLACLIEQMFSFNLEKGGEIQRFIHAHIDHLQHFTLSEINAAKRASSADSAIHYFILVFIAVSCGANFIWDRFVRRWRS